MKSNKMYLVLGDWSEDGHGKSEKVLVLVNKTVKEVQKAYKASCKLTGVSFNGNEDFTGLKRDYMEADKFQISVQYESGLEVSEEAREALEKHGLKMEKDFGADDPPKEFVALWFRFVGLSLPGLKYSVAKDEVPCINGYWNSDLNVSFGYGLYNGD